MAVNVVNLVLFFLLLAFASSHFALAGDPDIISDFVLPANTTSVDGSFFTFTGLRAVVRTQRSQSFAVSKATAKEFPALNGQSVFMSVLMFPAGSVNPPHTHPRSAELLFLIQGYLEVGLVDTANKLYTKTLQPGDMFVFPKGLVHYQHCNTQSPAVAVSAFGSASDGTVAIPRSVFTTGIDGSILAEAFKTDVATIQKLEAGLASQE